MAKGDNLKKFAKNLNTKALEVIEAIREEIDAFRPTLVNDINRTIKENKGLFDIEKIGGRELVRELGVGNAGKFSPNIKNAWEALQVDYPASGKKPTVLTFSKDKRKILKLDGKSFMSVTIDFNKTFYSQNVTNVVNLSKRGDAHDNRIPWMQWFIEGKVIKGFIVKDTKKDTKRQPGVKKSRFSENIKRFSRTGEALMIAPKSGGFWEVKPHPEPFDKLTDAVKITLEKSVIKFLSRIKKRFS